jgi:hypothetical protein
VRRRTVTSSIVASALLALVGSQFVNASTTPGSLTFSNAPLLRPEGNSEPAITVGADGTTAVSALAWETFGLNTWAGNFGAAPAFEGALNVGSKKAKTVLGGEDGDLEIASTGTLQATSLIVLVNTPFTHGQLGVSAVRCPNATGGSFDFAACEGQVIDTAGADRQWITTDGSRSYISYHDSGNSTLIHVQRSDDDGLTWHRVGSPIPGQGAATGDATFNNDQGPIVADPRSHAVYDIYAAGEPGIQKGTTATFNNIFVSKSTDGGLHWTSTLVDHRPLFTALNNVFPALAVDPVNGRLSAAWSDAHGVFFSTSSDGGANWSTAVTVNIAPATTAVFPWLAARNGTIDLVYYGTTAASKDDSSAVWNTYLAQTTDSGASFTQSRVSNAPNHVGVICTEGTGCASGTRNLLDLFEVAIDPLNGKAGVIYADDTLTVDASGNPLPQVVVAYQN